MALSYSSVDIRGNAVSPILSEIFYANKTIANGYVDFQSNIKAGTIFTEASMDVTSQLYTGLALLASGSTTVADTLVTPVKLEYKQKFLNESLRASRFGLDMASGAWNIDSNEFASTVLAMTGPAVSNDAEKKFWMGVTTASKAAIAALTGSSSTGRAVIAALPAGEVEGVISKVMSAGGYVAVTAVTVTSANIADEYAKIYAAIDPAVLADSVSPVKFYAPLSHRQLMRIANNAKGAAQQINFLFNDNTNESAVFYNGVEVYFVPITGFVLAQRPVAISWCTDLLDDVTKFEINKLQNDSDEYFVRTIYTLGAHVGQIANAVIYG